MGRIRAGEAICYMSSIENIQFGIYDSNLTYSVRARVTNRNPDIDSSDHENDV